MSAGKPVPGIYEKEKIELLTKITKQFLTDTKNIEPNIYNQAIGIYKELVLLSNTKGEKDD